MLEAGALPLSYARVAGEIGIEPMASCASDRRSTQAELLADFEVQSGPGRSRTDRRRIASAVLSRTELQAQGPAAIAGRRVFNYARTGVNSPERPMRTEWRSNSISPEKKKARIGPQQIESNESSPCLRSSEDGNNVGASVPPLRAGHGEMEARVDCGNADPLCVSALLCRCSRAEHLAGARWWKKESNLRVPCGSRPRFLSPVP